MRPGTWPIQLEDVRAAQRRLFLVRHQDLEKAREALEKYRKSARDIDWSEVDVGEPER